MDDGNGQERVEAGRQALPADDQAAVLFLEPGEGALRLESRHVHLERSTPRSAGLPHPFRQLGADTSMAELLAQSFGVIALICRQDLWTFAGSAAFAGVDGHRLQQRHDLRALVPIGRRRADGSWHAPCVREAMEEDALTFPPVGDAVTAAFARGKRSRRWPRTATESARALRQGRGCGLASRPASYQPASVAASDVPHSSTPIEARAGDHTSGSP